MECKDELITKSYQAFFTDFSLNCKQLISNFTQFIPKVYRCYCLSSSLSFLTTAVSPLDNCHYKE